MAVRIIKHIRKDLFGEIIALCNPEESWAPRQKHDAIQDIENGVHSYYLQWGTIRIDIRVANGMNGKYLIADHEKPIHNRLDKMRMN